MNVAEEYGLSQGRRKQRRSQTAATAELPNAAEAERAVLGCCVLEPGQCLNACVEKFRGRPVFHDLRRQTVWDVLVEMFEKLEAIDEVLVKQRLKDRGVLEQVGGLEAIDAMLDAVLSTANLPAWLQQVWNKYLLREASKAFSEAVAQIQDFPGDDVEQFLIGLEAKVSALTEAHASVSEEHIKGPLKRVVNKLEERGYRRGSMQLEGLPTGAPGNFLDKVIGGIRPDFYVVPAGRPGSGKTSLVMNWVEYWACDFEWFQGCSEEEAKAHVKEGKAVYQNENTKGWHRQQRGIPVCVFSIEMDGDSLTERLLFGRAGISIAEYKQGYAESAESLNKKLLGACSQLGRSGIYIDATPAQTIGQIAAKARRMVKQYGMKNTPPEVPPMVFVLDYIQLVEMENGDGFDRVKEITKISRKIMALKKQLRCPWIVNAQMNRNIETAERDRKPVLSDLKDCGALEQDADLVLFTYRTPRKELERQGSDEKGNPTQSQEQLLEAICEDWPWSKVPYRVDLVVPKNRFGPTGDAQMIFQKNLCRFEDWHLFKVKHGVEGLKSGESKRLMPTNEEMGVKPEEGKQ